MEDFDPSNRQQARINENLSIIQKMIMQQKQAAYYLQQYRSVGLWDAQAHGRSILAGDTSSISMRCENFATNGEGF